MRQLLLLLSLWGALLSPVEAARPNRESSHRSVSRSQPTEEWDAVQPDDDVFRDSPSDSEYWEDEEYSEMSNGFEYSTGSEGYKDVGPTEEEMKFEMPSLRSAFEGRKHDDRLSSGTGKGALYDAYNQLHTLAQVRLYKTESCFSKPNILSLFNLPIRSMTSHSIHLLSSWWDTNRRESLP